MHVPPANEAVPSPQLPPACSSASLLAFSGGQAQAARGVRRLVFRCQAFLLFPMMFLEAASLHGASLRSVTRRIREHRAGQHGTWEAALLTLHAAGYLTAVFLVLSPVRAVLFILVQQGLFGFYLACSFAPNDKGMPVLEAGDRTDFLRRQVLTSRNVRGGWLTDAALGGLNYRIEHHLFPSMPRPSLRRAQPLVAAFCADRGLPYCQTHLLGSYAQALRHLSSVGKLTGPAADAGTDRCAGEVHRAGAWRSGGSGGSSPRASTASPGL